MSHIIIEGCDKVGKTTLAYELAKELYFPIVKRLKPKKNIFTECIDFFTSCNESMIVDRFHLSEEAYGPLKRKKSRFDFRELKLIELSCLSLNTFNIYCVDDREKIKERMIREKEDFLLVSEIDEILRNFDLSLNKSILKWHYYTIGDDIKKLAKQIKKEFKKKDLIDRYKIFNEYGTVGNYDGKILILDERYRSSIKTSKADFKNNRINLELFKAIEESKISWNEIIISNAINSNIKLNQEKTSLKEISFKNIKKIICLNENTYEKTKKLLGKDKTKKNIYNFSQPTHFFKKCNGTIKEYSKALNDIYEK